MEQVTLEIKTLTTAELYKTRKRSNRRKTLREAMSAMQYGEYFVVPVSMYSHNQLRPAVHMIAQELGRGQFRCMKDKETGELRVLYLGE